MSEKIDVQRLQTSFYIQLDAKINWYHLCYLLGFPLLHSYYAGRVPCYSSTRFQWLIKLWAALGNSREIPIQELVGRQVGMVHSSLFISIWSAPLLSRWFFYFKKVFSFFHFFHWKWPYYWFCFIIVSPSSECLSYNLPYMQFSNLPWSTLPIMSFSIA